MDLNFPWKLFMFNLLMMSVNDDDGESGNANNNVVDYFNIENMYAIWM